MLFALSVAFLSGFLSLALAQTCLALFFLKRFLSPRPYSPPRSASSLSFGPTASFSGPPHLSFEGDVWVAAAPVLISGQDATKALALASKECKRKKDGANDNFEIFPSRRHARLEDQMLIFMADDGTEERIDMTGCTVLSVSGGKEVSRKWAKKYPIKLESCDRELFAGSFVCLLYLETGREKEAWCQVLRAASRWNSNIEDLFLAQKREFHEYSSSLNEAYPSFTKFIPSKRGTVVDEKGRTSKVEAGLSKRQKLLRKLAKKVSWKGNVPESKSGSGHGDSKGSSLECNSGSRHDSLNASVSLQSGGEAVGHFPKKHNVDVASSSAEHFNSDKMHTEDVSDVQNNLDRTLSSELRMPVIDQGTICCNVLFSRLFFDLYHTTRFQMACHRLIQKQLSKIVTPGYIGGIKCSSLELGTMPPFFHSMQILPKDSDFMWSFEAGIEYSGGALVKLETRLDVQDSLSQEDVVAQIREPTLAGAAAADILQKGLASVEDTVGADGKVTHAIGSLNSESGDTRGSKANTWMQTSKGGWKAALSRVASLVSQMPITLSLRVASLKGTLRAQIKVPPTDHIWFGFTSMPTIDLQLEPSIGDHRITTGPIVAFITNRIKMLIQDMLVLPNCEGVWVPWMISEKDDWIPRSAMPVPWSPHGTSDDEAQTLRDSGKTSITKEQYPTAEQYQALRHSGKTSITKEQCPPTAGAEETDVFISTAPSTSGSISAEMGVSSELEKPLLEKLESTQEADGEGILMPNLPTKQREIFFCGNLSSSFASDELAEGKESSKRARMLNLGKKVAEKLDEKRRNILERMREGFEKPEQTGQ